LALTSPSSGGRSVGVVRSGAKTTELLLLLLLLLLLSAVAVAVAVAVVMVAAAIQFGLSSGATLRKHSQYNY
jgi:hypothetical protein